MQRDQEVPGIRVAKNHPVSGLGLMLALSVLLTSFASSCGSALPSATPTPTVPPRPARTPLPESSPTQAIYPTPTSTQVNLAQVYDLPAWMGDPNTVILTVLTTTDRYGVTTAQSILFLSASTGEEYELQVPSYAGQYFWLDPMHFGLLKDDLQVKYIIDVTSGQVVTSPVSPEATQFIDKPGGFGPLVIRQDQNTAEGYTFEYAYSGWRGRSRRYTAELDTGQPGYPITVFDRRSGETVWQSSPVDGLWEISYAWSPVRADYLAVVRGTLVDENFFGAILDNRALEVIDVSTGEVAAYHQGDVGKIQWSPDGNQILYEDSASLYWNLGYASRKAPCIFNIVTSENKCIWSIPNRQVPEGYQLLTISGYQWSRDGRSIYFTYDYSSNDQVAGNLCIYSLVDGSITCPAENLPAAQGWNINWYFGWHINAFDFSPDEQFIHICLSSNHPLSDDQGGEEIDGLIDIRGTRLVHWAGLILEERNFDLSKCSVYSPIWRPLP